MTKDILDIFVIGGGVNGVAIARDAAGRGYRVVLSEQDDLASIRYVLRRIGIIRRAVLD